MCLLLVMSLKRLLVGSISLSEDSQGDEENGEEQSELDSCHSTGRNHNSVSVCLSVSKGTLSLTVAYNLRARRQKPEHGERGRRRE